MSEAPTISPNDVLVRAQETPNPYALKFICNHALKTEGKATFQAREEAEGLPMVQSLFDIPGVVQVYLFQNTLTVTHSGELPGQIVKDQCVSIIKTRLPIHNPDFQSPDSGGTSGATSANKDRSNLPEEVQKIESILDRTVRPGLQADGGDIEVISFENDELRILYQGACGGCPSAMMGTLEAIQGILRQEMDNPEIIVVPI